ncbi:MAG: tetratricopeptide repeat protein [Tepidisphaeraceae bacterium]
MTDANVDQAFQLAVEHHRAGRLAEAERIYRNILKAQANHAGAIHLLGMIAGQTGHDDVAIELINRAIRLKPDYADAHCNLGNILKDMGRIDGAIESYRRAIRFKPDCVEAHCNLGAVLKERGLLDEAIASSRRAIELKGDLAEAHVNLGNALMNKRRIDEAVAAYQRAIQINPNHADAHCNLGNVLLAKGRLDAAIASCRRAIELRPDYAPAFNNLGIALKNSGQLEEAIASLRRAADAGNRDGHTNLLLTLMYDPAVSAESILAEHRAWSDRYARPLAGEIVTHSNDRSPDRRLRIGYVSGDFRGHPVGHFILPLLERHDRSNFQVTCYSNVPSPDIVTERAKRSCDEWRDVIGLTDAELATRIRADGIDILVDLSGHTSNSRLLAFARQPAPIQVTYLGYPNTTGMTAIDYRITDSLADPPGMTDDLNVEKLWRLPDCAWCYDAPEDLPEIRAREGEPITFGCFNTLAKINAPLLDIWAKLLDRVAGSRLLLKSAGAGQASVRKRLSEQFAARGVSADRIEMLGHITDVRRHLELYNRVDVAFDTFPYHGTMTTCGALRMGVPVVTLIGRAHVSRVGFSLLSQVGLPELAASDPEQYVRVAAELAGDAKRLGELRRTLRARMEASPLMDAPRFARNVEAAYRQMWRNWCAMGGNSSLQCPAP